MLPAPPTGFAVLVGCELLRWVGVHTPSLCVVNSAAKFPDANVVSSSTAGGKRGPSSASLGAQHGPPLRRHNSVTPGRSSQSASALQQVCGGVGMLFEADVTVSDWEAAGLVRRSNLIPVVLSCCSLLEGRWGDQPLPYQLRVRVGLNRQFASRRRSH